MKKLLELRVCHFLSLIFNIILGKHVTEMRADLGGTNVLRPLANILEEKPREGIARQIFLLTGKV